MGTLLTPLEKAHILRSTAEWVNNPTTPITHNCAARRKDGSDCEVWDPQVHSYCLLGYMAKLYGDRHDRLIDGYHAAEEMGWEKPKEIYELWDFCGMYLARDAYIEFRFLRDCLIRKLTWQAEDFEAQALGLEVAREPIPA